MVPELTTFLMSVLADYRPVDSDAVVRGRVQEEQDVATRLGCHVSNSKTCLQLPAAQ
jgi:hypothetical protein